MDIAAMLEPVHSAPYMSSSVSSPLQQRLPSLKLATASEQHIPQYARSLPKPLPPLSPLSLMASRPPPSPQQHQVQRMGSTSSAASSVHVPLQQTPLPMQQYQHQHQHQRQQGHDNSTRRDSSDSSSRTGTTSRHRGKQTKAACIPCRKRKSKCDGVRPSCKSCIGKVTACEYSVNPGVTQQQAVKNQLDAYKHVLNLLRQGSVAECNMLIKQLRAQEDLAEAVGDIMRDRILNNGSSRPGA